MAVIITDCFLFVCVYVKNGGKSNGKKSTGLFKRNSEDYPQQHISGCYGSETAGLS